MAKNKSKKNENVDNEKGFSKMSIVWYPGHMAKTRRQIEEDLKLVDIVIELLDSRIPVSSRNPEIAKITKNKDKIIVLNKSDLADSAQNELWIKYFKENGQVAIAADCNSGKGINEILRAIEKIKKEDQEKYAEKGRVGRIRAMVLGIPNVGKSSFINRVSKNNNLKVGNKPGVTKSKQWIRINEKIELLDTPGVLWPKFENEQVALNLSFTGTIKDDILPITEVAYQLLKFLLENYRQNVIQRYKLTEEYIEQILSKPEPENFNIYEIMQEIGRKRGQIMSGGEVDDEYIEEVKIDSMKVYSREEIANDPVLTSYEIGEKDIVFSAEYSLKISDKCEDKMQYTAATGEIDGEWVINKYNVGIAKYDAEKDSYEITNFGTGF